MRTDAEGQPSSDSSFPVAVPRAMSRCECAGVSFHEIARRIRDEGAHVEDVCAQTGCGHTCTACLPDLRRFLAED